MSLNSILGTALTGLSVSQESIRVTSSNVANINTPGYARRVVEQETQVIGGLGAGVQVSEVRRIADLFISKELRIATAQEERYGAMSKLHDVLQSLLGDPADNSSLTGKLDAAFSSFSALALDGSSLAARTAVVSDLGNLAAELNGLSDGIQDLRADADGQVAADVATVNAAIERIYDLNQLIVREQRSGGNPSALIDQRDQAISEISKVLDIRTFELTSGGVGISTSSGLALLDDTKRALVYDAPGTVTSSTGFSQITVNRVNSLTGDIDTVGISLDDKVRSGSLSGWLEMRDRQLPSFAAQLGELAANLADRMNAIHNDHTAVPPPATLTGVATGLTGTDTHNFTGEATFYAIDANNNITNQVTIDFGAVGPSLNDVIAAVNAGLGGDGTLSLTNGVMSLAAGGGATGVAIQQDTANPSDRGGRGFSHFFGMNDLLQSQVASHFDTGVAAADAHNFTGTMNIQLRGPSNEVPVDVVIDFGALGGSFAAVEAELDTQFAGYLDFSFGSNGELVTTPAAAYGDHKLHIVTDSSNRAGTGKTFSAMFGIGDRYQTDAARDMQLRSPVADNSFMLAVAKVDTVGTPSVTLADGAGATAFFELGMAEVNFDAVGGAVAVQTSLSKYGAQLIGNIGTEAAQADGYRQDRQALRAELESRTSEVQGVNLDEELANMMLYQTAYNAAARMIQTAQQMYDVLANL